VQWPEELPEISSVVWDAGVAARVAVEHLVETGRERIGFVGADYPMRMHRARHKAYLDVVREAGLSFREEWVSITRIDCMVDQIIGDALERMFAPGREAPDAIFAINDGLALPLLEALDARGIRVPEDVAVIGLGDLSMTRHSGISLSTVREPCEEMGRQAAEVLVDLIADPGKAPIHRVIPGHVLRIRRSTQPRREGD